MTQVLLVGLILAAQGGFPEGTIPSGFKATFTDPAGGVLEGVTADITGVGGINIQLPASTIDTTYNSGTAFAIDQFGTIIGTPVQISPAQIIVPASILPTTVFINVVAVATASLGTV